MRCVYRRSGEAGVPIYYLVFFLCHIHLVELRIDSFVLASPYQSFPSDRVDTPINIPLDNEPSDQS